MLHQRAEDESEKEDPKYLSLDGYYLLGEWFHIECKLYTHQPIQFIPPVRKQKTFFFLQRREPDSL